MVGTVLAPVIGYDQASKLAKEAFTTGETIREIVLRKELLSDEELDGYLNFAEMTRPHA
jgi:fumarate hydratase class II